MNQLSKSEEEALLTLATIPESKKTMDSLESVMNSVYHLLITKGYVSYHFDETSNINSVVLTDMGMVKVMNIVA